jgi:alanyl-tRNA synthetase
MQENATSFIIAGMQPLMPYFSGAEVPPSPRLTSLQRCLRTDDVEMVGRNIAKLSAFHMLGNWSIGDYGRPEAVAMTAELLSMYGLGWENLWVTTFGGDATLGLAPDEETHLEWLRIGVPPDRLIRLGTEDNFWSTGGPGPCGRDSELFFDRGVRFGCGRPDCRPGCECERFLEIWNLVFIEFDLQPDGSMLPLPLRSVDTGMGLERIAMVLQRASSVFEIDLFAGALERLLELTLEPANGTPTAERQRRQSQRMILDHMRSVLFLGTEGIVPARTGRGSALRRLIRRAATRGRLLGIPSSFLSELLPPLAMAENQLLAGVGEGDIDSVGKRNLNSVGKGRLGDLEEMVRVEERSFAGTLKAGLLELGRIVPDARGMVPGERLFQLHAERGFPVDLATEVLEERGIQIEWSGFQRADRQHREVSRSRREPSREDS